MIKNGVLYTNENGSIDDKLVTDRPCLAEVDEASRWVHANILPDPDDICDRSSYGLKHLLESDTGLYFTNNEFKHLMLLMGYEPVDPKELNWRYHVILKRDRNDNPSPFFKWCTMNYHREGTPEYDFAQEMLHDRDFPILACEEVIRWYLEKTGACEAAVSAFDSLWSEYLQCQEATV